MTTDPYAEAAFAAIWDRHRDGVHAFLLARTSDREAARDLLQETFLRVWRRLDDVAALDEGPQRGWVFTVARNLVVDRHRSGATRAASIAALGREAGLARGVPDAAEEAVARDALTRLGAAIAELDEEQRVILTMTAVGGMTSAEVGEALGRPAGTVRYELHRARAALARRLEAP